MKKIFLAIESADFAARLSIESSLTRVTRSLTSQPEVKKIFELIEQKALLPEELFKRIIKLGDQSVDPRYENPMDIAFTTYLWVLVGTDPKLASAAAEVILNVPGCWWAYKVANKVVQGRALRARDSVDTVKYVNLSRPTTNRAKETFLVSSLTHSRLSRPTGNVAVRPTSMASSSDSELEPETEHGNAAVAKTDSPHNITNIEADE